LGKKKHSLRAFVCLKAWERGGVGNPTCVTLPFPYQKTKTDPILGTNLPHKEQSCPDSTLQFHKMPPSACESSAQGGVVHANAKVKILGQVSPGFSLSFFVNLLCFSLSVCDLQRHRMVMPNFHL